MTDDFDDFDESSPKNRTGRFTLQHRGNNRVEVGEPIRVPNPGPGGRPWMCIVKLLGHGDEPESEATLTLLVRTGRGNTPEEAQRDAMAQLSLLYGTPAGPPPAVVITKKTSEPPIADAAALSQMPTVPPSGRVPKSGPLAWLGRLLGRSSK